MDSTETTRALSRNPFADLPEKYHAAEWRFEYNPSSDMFQVLCTVTLVALTDDPRVARAICEAGNAARGS